MVKLSSNGLSQSIDLGYIDCIGWLWLTCGFPDYCLAGILVAAAYLWVSLIFPYYFWAETHAVYYIYD